MKTRQTLLALRIAVGLTALGAVPTLLAGPHETRIRFTGSEYPTGEVFDPGNTIGLLPDADGILRARGIVVGGCMALRVPELQTPDLVIYTRNWANFNLDSTAGFSGMTWCSWDGYMTDSEGNQVLVAQGFAYGFRRKISDTKWLEQATIVGLFCNGPLEGVVMNATDTVESWDPTMATGYMGKVEGVLTVPDSVDLRAHRGWKPCAHRR